MDINSTPTPSNEVNTPDNPQVDPPEYLTCYHEYPPEGHIPHSKFILTHYTTNHGTCLSLHPIPHRDHIHYRYLVNKLSNTYNRCRACVKMHKDEEGRRPLSHQGLPKEKLHPCALRAQGMVVAPVG